MTKELTGKVALVTGASKGISAGVAKVLAARGASVAVNAAAFGAVDTVVNNAGRAGTPEVA